MNIKWYIAKLKQVGVTRYGVKKLEDLTKSELRMLYLIHKDKANPNNPKCIP